MSSRKEDINTFIEIEGNPISKVGVFPYSGAQISTELEPDKMYNVYRPEEELSDPETIASFRLIPWTDEHTMLSLDPSDGLTDPTDKGVEGVIGENVYFEDGYLKANLKIFSNKLASLIDSGKKELSIGYRCLYELAEGVYNGVKYDAIQRQIRGNHVALVHEGRSGADVAVLDAFRFTFDTGALQMADIEEQEVMSLEECARVIRELKDRIEELERDDTTEVVIEDEEMGPDFLVEEAKLNEPLDEAEEEEEKPAEAMDSMKAIFAQISRRDSLAKKLSQHIGVFDHREKTLSEVAQYGVRKLKLSCAAGHEESTLNGYLQGARVSVPAVGQDSARIESSCVDKYLEGVR